MSKLSVNSIAIQFVHCIERHCIERNSMFMQALMYVIDVANDPSTKLQLNDMIPSIEYSKASFTYIISVI